MRIVYVPGTRESAGNVNGSCPASAPGSATIKRANALIMIFTALSNETRLSCGADQKFSQIEDYRSKTAPPASGAC